MNNYYTSKKIAQDTYQIYEPGNVYSYLVTGTSEALLIDCGYGFGKMKEYAATLTDKPVTVVLTHGHTDHAGAAWQFPFVYMNLSDMPTFLWYDEIQRPLIISKFKRDRAAAGLPDIWPEEFDEKAYLDEHSAKIRNVKNGHIFELGGHRVHVIYMPGHTEGSVILYDETTRILFSGDNIGNSLWIFFNTSTPLLTYAKYLSDIRLLDISGILCGHYANVMPPEIVTELLETIMEIDPAHDTGFVHPRTGQTATRHKKVCKCLKDVRFIYVVYDKKKISAPAKKGYSTGSV